MLDMINLFSIAPGNIVRTEGLSYRPGESCELFNILEQQFHVVILDKKEPVPSPSHVTPHSPVSRDKNVHVCGFPITYDVVDCYLAVFMQNRTHSSNGRLDQVPARGNLHHVRQCDNEPDCPMTAHSQVANVIKEDDTGRAGRIRWIAEKATYHNV
jgi:hypothetical protein